MTDWLFLNTIFPYGDYIVAPDDALPIYCTSKEAVQHEIPKWLLNNYCIEDVQVYQRVSGSSLEKGIFYVVVKLPPEMEDFWLNVAYGLNFYNYITKSQATIKSIELGKNNVIIALRRVLYTIKVQM